MVSKLMNFCLWQAVLLFCEISVSYAQLNFDVYDYRQPLAINNSPTQNSDTSYSYTAPVPISNDDYTITFNREHYEPELISACPKKKKTREILWENINNKRTCETIPQPSIRNKATAIEIATVYSVGYWMPAFVEIFSIYYSQQNTLLYTFHIIYPGRTISITDWSEVTRNGIFTSTLRPYSESSGRYKVQIVPSDHFLAMPWKLATLIDINFISVSNRLKNDLETLDDYLHDYVNNTGVPLQVFSGVKSKAWYWKLVMQGQHGLLLIIANSAANSFTVPCSDNCREFNLEKLEEKIPQLYCCPYTESLMTQLNIAIIQNNLPFYYLQLADAMIFQSYDED